MNQLLYEGVEIKLHQMLYLLLSEYTILSEDETTTI